MKALFFDADRRLRNGWWILLFVVVFLLSRWIYTPLSRVLREAGVGGEWIEPLRFVFVLLVTGIWLL